MTKKRKTSKKAIENSSQEHPSKDPVNLFNREEIRLVLAGSRGKKSTSVMRLREGLPTAYIIAGIRLFLETGK